MFHHNPFRLARILNVYCKMFGISKILYLRMGRKALFILTTTAYHLSSQLCNLIISSWTHGWKHIWWSNSCHNEHTFFFLLHRRVWSITKGRAIIIFYHTVHRNLQQGAACQNCRIIIGCVFETTSLNLGTIWVIYFHCKEST